MCEIGESRDALQAIKSGLSDLVERKRRDKTSLWIRSREAWFRYFAHAFSTETFKDWERDYNEFRCNPWDELSALEKNVEEASRIEREDNTTITPLFKPGHYKDTSRSIRLVSSGVAHPWIEIDKIIEFLGLPMVLYQEASLRVGVTLKLLRDTLRFRSKVETLDIYWYIRLISIISDPSDLSFNIYFGRVGVARMRIELVDLLERRSCLGLNSGSNE